jgi:signal peptidase
MNMSLHRALGVVYSATLAVLCVLSVLLLAATAPTLLGFESFVVKSSEMRPLLNFGDLAVVAPVKVDKLAIGDVITYRDPNDTDVPITRRIRSLAPDEQGQVAVETTFDANPMPEPLSVAPGMTLGRLAFVIPHLGRLVNFASQPIGRLLLLGVPGLLLSVEWLRGRLRRRNAPVVAAPTQAQRIEALLDGGRRALLAGQAQLAGRAAEAVLVLNPTSTDAWRLKALALEALAATPVPTGDREHVAA